MSDSTKKALRPEDIDVVLFHAECPDGIGSAYAVWKRFPDKDIKYIGLRPKQDPPSDLKGGILSVDYSPRLEITMALIRRGPYLVCDHHETSKQDLESVPEENKIFDMEHSACWLAWKFVHGTEPPLFLRYIEARDLYKLDRFPDVAAFHAWFYLKDLAKPVRDVFRDYDSYNNEVVLQKGIRRGKHYLDVLRIKASETADHSTIHFCCIKKKYYLVATVNTVSLAPSDVAAVMFERYPLADFAALYSVGPYNTSFSLRSFGGDKKDDGKGTNVAMIAKSFDGGGHAAAAGLSLVGCHNRLPGQYYDNGELYKTLTNPERVTHYWHDSDKFDVMQVNYAQHKKHLAMYLLQDRIAVRIYLFNLGIVQDVSINPIRLIVIRHYDDVSDKTHFVAAWNLDAASIVRDVLGLENSPCDLWIAGKHPKIVDPRSSGLEYHIFFLSFLF